MEEKITREQYQKGILDVCDSLVSDLLQFLKDEGRYKYRMIDHMDKIMSQFAKIYDAKIEGDMEICERVVFVSYRYVRSEFLHLRRSKHLSPADSVICILLKLIEISNEIQETKDLKEVTDILQGFYDNIRNRGKSDKLKRLYFSLHKAIEEGRWGKLRRTDVDLYSVEHPSEKVHDLDGEKQSWGSSEGEEIEL